MFGHRQSELAKMLVERGRGPVPKPPAPGDPRMGDPRTGVCRLCGRQRTACCCVDERARDHERAHVVQFRELRDRVPYDVYGGMYLGGVAKYYWEGGEVRAGRAGRKGTNLHEEAAVGDAGAVAERLDAGESPGQRDFEGQTALHWAARAGQIEVAQLLLDRGCPVGGGDSAGRTALHVACCVANPAMAELLAARGAPLNARDAGGRTPLHYAANTGHLGHFEMLLAKGAIPEIKDNAGADALGAAKGPTAHMAVKKILEGLERRREEEAERLRWERRAAQGYVRAEKKEPDPRAACALCGRVGGACSCDVDPVERRLWERKQAAADEGRIGGFEEAAAAGQGVPGRHYWHEGRLHAAPVGDKAIWELGGPNLHAAAQRGDAAGVRRRLARGEDPNQRDYLAQTPLHCAARNSRLEAATELLRGGARAGAPDANGLTPLHVCGQAGSDPRAVELLVAHHADVDARDGALATPLHHAASRGHLATVEALLRAGCSTELRDSSHRTAQEVVPSRHAEARALIQRYIDEREAHKGAPPPPPKLRAPWSTVSDLRKPGDLGGKEPPVAAKAAWPGQWDDSDVDLEQWREKGGYYWKGGKAWEAGQRPERLPPKRTPFVAERGNRDGMHLEARDGDAEAVSTRLARGEEVDQRDFLRSTPLHLAAFGGHLEVAELLLGRNATVDAEDAQGRTPLMRACSMGHAAVVRRLLHAGAHLSCRDDMRRNCLHLAVLSDSTECVRLILEAYPHKPPPSHYAPASIDLRPLWEHQDNSRKRPLELAKSEEIRLLLEAWRRKEVGEPAVLSQTRIVDAAGERRWREDLRALRVEMERVVHARKRHEYPGTQDPVRYGRGGGADDYRFRGDFTIANQREAMRVASGAVRLLSQVLQAAYRVCLPREGAALPPKWTPVDTVLDARTTPWSRIDNPLGEVRADDANAVLALAAEMRTVLPAEIDRRLQRHVRAVAAEQRRRGDVPESACEAVCDVARDLIEWAVYHEEPGVCQ